jgi:nitroimidazol reductase NimA-like FMN-containing flavoprotein (pyridoxamine 5'-phosphate oxidase superfamily)
VEPITPAEARQFLEEAKVAHIGVVSDGEPYVTPMSFVVDGDRILFRTKPGRRYEALRANPNVSIEVSRFDDETGDWTSVIVNGVARECPEGDCEQTVEMLMKKYESVLGSPLAHGGGLQPMSSFPHVVLVEIKEISGMTSGRGFTVRTRPGRL